MPSGVYVRTLEVRKQMRERNKGEGNPMFGRKRPDLCERNKLDNPAKRPEVQLKMRESHLTKKWSEERKIKRSIQIKGENNPMFGRKRPDVSKRLKECNPMKDLKQRENLRERMKNGQSIYMLHFNKNPSKEQVQLYQQVLKFYPTAILNYPYLRYSLDIAIPELKIDIEFDGYYYHKGREEQDRIRTELIEKTGWKVLRYSKIPRLLDLKKSILTKKHARWNYDNRQIAQAGNCKGNGTGYTGTSAPCGQ